MPSLNRRKLSPAQLEAVRHTTGPALIIAGPGSGKTTVIVNRIRNLIIDQSVDPYHILVITFSKAAAIQMQQRFEKTSVDHFPVTFGTFHSVFYNILRHSGKNDSMNVATLSYKRKLISRIIERSDPDHNTEQEYLDLILRRISYYKNSAHTNDNENICSLDRHTFLNIYNEYNDMLRAEGRLDFEDMMLMCRDLMRDDPLVRKKWQDRFKYILIDEFQDINMLQFDIVKLLLGSRNNIFAVGDDDQSIYGFRGANPDIMRQFGDHFPDARIIMLTCNYRSGSEIVKSASRLISHNQNRYEKDIVSYAQSGDPVSVREYKDRRQELDDIANMADSFTKDNQNTAILCRTNTGVGEIAEHLLKKNIPCHVTEKPHDPYDDVIFRDFARYMRLALSPDAMETKDFVPVANKPVRYINRNLIPGRYTDITLLKGLYKDRDYVVRALSKLEYDLKQLKHMDMFSAFNYFRCVIGYDEYIKKNSDEKLKFADYQSRADDLMMKMKDFDTFDELARHVERMAQLTDRKETVKIDDTGIYVMTYHASKGLEFDNVFLPGLIEGEVPSKRSITIEDIEEERRMLYVAMTRAKERLFMSYTGADREKKHLRSRFLTD